jgi:ferric-dicitrate binding protein FerR (iron transport regulator)
VIPLKLLAALPEVNRIRTATRWNDPACRLHFDRRFLFAAILAGATVFASAAMAATPVAGPAACAASVVGQNAELNGRPMPAGATLFPGDVIRIGRSSAAALQFGSSTVRADAQTELVVESAGVTLRAGILQVRAGGADTLAVSGPFFRVSVASSAGIPSSAEIHLGEMRAQISALAGAADLTALGGAAPIRLHAGESATLDTVPPDATADQTSTNPAAGQISRLLPQVQIDRASQHIVASGSDRVYWNDNLRSGPTGRAHITLKDGSQLNLGSDSSLRILQHDAQAQQTSLDLLVGRVRGKITKLTKSGSKFEVHTPVGIAGLVGTDFSLLVTDDYTELIVNEGTVRFTPTNGQSVTVNSGMKLRISKSGVIDGPSSASAQEIQSAEALTDITGSANQAAVGAATARPLAPLVITLTGAAAGVGIGVWQATRPTVSVSIP